MFYLITQVLLLLIAASILGAILGWLLRRVGAARAESELNDKLFEAETALPPMRDALRKAERNLQNKDSSIADLQNQLWASEGKIGPLEDLNTQVAALQDALQSAEADHRKSADELAAALNTQQHLADELRASLDGSESERSQLESALADLRNQVAAANQQNDALERKRQSMDDELKKLAERLEQAMQAHAKASAESAKELAARASTRPRTRRRNCAMPWTTP